MLSPECPNFANIYFLCLISWTEVAPMSLMRSRVALVNNAGKLYAIGGYDGELVEK
jgi:hypothetical protein